MTDSSEHFEQAQRDRLAELRAATSDKPIHAEFLEDLANADPGDILDDLPRPRGLSRVAAEALIADFEWTLQVAPEPGMTSTRYPNAYAQLRLKTARATAASAATREHNATWGGLYFKGE
jgi:hypothetical protein